MNYDCWRDVFLPPSVVANCFLRIPPGRRRGGARGRRRLCRARAQPLRPRGRSLPGTPRAAPPRREERATACGPPSHSKGLSLSPRSFVYEPPMAFCLRAALPYGLWSSDIPIVFCLRTTLWSLVYEPTTAGMVFCLRDTYSMVFGLRTLYSMVFRPRTT